MDMCRNCSDQYMPGALPCPPFCSVECAAAFEDARALPPDVADLELDEVA
jgi:hypothetical protein